MISVAYGYWEQKGLTSVLMDQGPYEFAVSGAGDDYIDLANTYDISKCWHRLKTPLSNVSM
jgi:hypothetical protein